MSFERILKVVIVAVAFCHAMVGLAQEKADIAWKPEGGVELTSELQATHARKYNNVNLLRLNASLPISGALRFEVASLSTCMTSTESIGKDLQTFSNLDAGNIPFALSLCNLAWQVNDRHSLFLGIRNMNEDYFCSPLTSLFTNSSCGIFPTISANFDIANYPVASVGVHYQYEFCMRNHHGVQEAENEEDTDHCIFQASLYNGRGYYRFTGRENVFRFCPKSDGVFGLAQMEYQHRGSSYFLGACGRYAAETEVDKRKFRASLWTYAEQQLTPRFSLMAAYSHSFSSAACSDFAGIGGRYICNLASTGRTMELGLFSDYAHFAESREFATELTCKFPVSQHFYLQPTLHAISTQHETGQSTRNFSLVAAARIGFSF